MGNKASDRITSIDIDWLTEVLQSSFDASEAKRALRETAEAQEYQA